ncbi:hypothetical protein FDENT_8600 [Fusarium denticulatum]|uniref:Uncharacterized protein n=1 Tax=Fusarium denticulatum TaxID=48507 RepID=A0A8H5TZA9_9HYPO|nr:hypothetical protein FDENT_8600 [Fusarium denticulatum]
MRSKDTNDWPPSSREVGSLEPQMSDIVGTDSYFLSIGSRSQDGVLERPSHCKNFGYWMIKVIADRRSSNSPIPTTSTASIREQPTVTLCNNNQQPSRGGFGHGRGGRRNFSDEWTEERDARPEAPVAKTAIAEALQAELQERAAKRQKVEEKDE